MLFFAHINPLYQDAFQGLFLVVAVVLGALVGRLVRVADMSVAGGNEVAPALPELPAFLTPDRLRVIFAFGAVVLVFVVGDILHPGFASAGSVKAILLTASFVGFVAAGQTFVVLIGGIDLSVPWVLNGAAILLVTTSLGRDSRTWWALPLTLGDGARRRDVQRHRRRLPRRARRS